MKKLQLFLFRLYHLPALGEKLPGLSFFFIAADLYHRFLSDYRSFSSSLWEVRSNFA